MDASTAVVTKIREGKLIFAVLVLSRGLMTRVTAQQTIPTQWHQALTQQEKAWVSQIVNALRRVPDFPKLAAPVHLRYGTPLEMQINAWESDKQITVPAEMVRFLKDDPSAFAFLLAHEAGHAK